jgi:hypothetical protein
MNLLPQRTNGLVASLAIVLFTPALTNAATVIDHVPYTITASGQYELQTDFTIGENESPEGITVKAANVIINLNGFTLAHKNSDSRFPGGIGIDVLADNVSVRNGTISGFQWGVQLTASHGRAQDLTLLGNDIGVLVASEDLSPLSDIAVVNCFISGLGTTGIENSGIETNNASGTLIKDNQVSSCLTGITSIGITSGSPRGNAIIHNYVSDSGTGLDLSDHDCYQGTVVTNCKTAFKGGHAVGGENGSD